MNRFLRRQWLGLIVFTIATAGAAGQTASPTDVEAAVQSGDVARMQNMIAQGGGPASDAAAMLLMQAAADGNQGALAELLRLGVSVDTSPQSGPGWGETALMWAVSHEQPGAVDFLLRKGADPNFIGHSPGAISERIHFALIGAVANDSLPITRLLLNGGANPNLSGAYAMQLANAMNEFDLYQLLVQHGGQLPRPPVSAAKVGVQVPAPNSIKALGLAELVSSPPAVRKGNQTRTTCRLAVIADEPDIEAAELVLTRLGAIPNVELVERQELDRVIVEQHLSRDFSGAIAAYRDVAATVHADALLLIRTRELMGARAVEAKFVRVDPGVVLDTAYQAAPLSGKEAWAGDIAERVRLLVAKTLRSDAIALSVLDVHAALPNATASRLADTLSVLLRDRFVHDPRFVLLERSDMEKVAFESGGGDFWAGSYLVDPLIDAALDNSGRFTLKMRFQPNGRARPIAIMVESNAADLAATLDQLWRQLDAALGSSVPPANRNVLAEADSYLEEARWALAANLPLRAEADAEAAWALGRQSPEVAELRVRSALLAVREACLQPLDRVRESAPRWLDLATHAVGVWRDMLESDSVRRDTAALRAWLDSSSELTEGVKFALVALPGVVDRTPHRKRLAALGEAYWGAMREASLRAKQLPASSDALNKIALHQAEMARVAVSNPSELAADLRDLFGRHFAHRDAVTRAEMRVSFEWDRVSAMVPESGGRSNAHAILLPPDKAAKAEFLRFLRASSAPDDHYLATTLEIGSWTGEVPEAEATRVMAGFWDMRDLLAGDGEAFAVYLPPFEALTLEAPLAVKGGVRRQMTLALDDTGPTRMDTDEFYRHLCMYLLAHATGPRPQLRELLSRHRFAQASFPELQEVYEQYARRTGDGTPNPFARGSAAMRRPTSERPVGPAASASAQSAANGPLLRVTRLWWPRPGDTLNGFTCQSTAMQWAEDRLWFHGYATDNTVEPRQAHRYLFSVNCDNGQSTKLELPVTPQNGGFAPESAFIVTPRQIVVAAARDYLAVYDRAARHWDRYDDIKPDPTSDILLENGAVYVLAADSTALVRFDLAARQSTLLASTRRKPGESPLDVPDLRLTRVWKGEGDEILVRGESDPTTVPLPFVKTTVVAWSPATGTWRTVQPLQPKSASRMESTQRAGLERLGRLSGARGIVSALQLNPHQSGGPLTLSFVDQTAAPVPIEIVPPRGWVTDPLQGGGRIMVAVCLGCPAGYIFPMYPDGPAFWFLPRAEMQTYLGRHAAAN